MDGRERPVPVRVRVTTEQNCDGSRPFWGGQSSDEATVVGRIGPGRPTLSGWTSQYDDTSRVSCILSHIQGVGRLVPILPASPRPATSILTVVYGGATAVLGILHHAELLRADLVKGTALSNISIDGKDVRKGEEFEAPADVMKNFIRIGVVEDPAAKEEAAKEAKAATAAADAEAAKIVEAAKDEAKDLLEKAEAEADEKAKAVLDEAHAEADKLVADAKAEAQKILDEAKAEASKAAKPAETVATGDKSAKPGTQSK